jgi:hypothetical protein
MVGPFLKIGSNMGYYTYFSLSYHGSQEDEEALQNFEPGDEFAFPEGIKELIDDSQDANWKWYGWEKDMKLLASKFPNILFILNGDGEESDDLWEFRIKGDVSEFHRMEIPPFTTPELINY